MTKSSDVIVVGGGIIGLTTTLFLARLGMVVVVFDQTEMGREASWAGAGIIPPGDPEWACSPVDQLRAIGSSRFSAFSTELLEQTGIDNGYRCSGGIEFLSPSDSDLVGEWSKQHIDAVHLSQNDLKLRVSQFGEMEGEPYFLPGYAQVRNPRHLQALLQACKSLNVSFRTNESVTDLLAEGSRLVGVETAEGKYFAGSVLIASGAWSGKFLTRLGVHLEVAPVLGQIVLYRCPRREFEPILLFGKEYMVPRDDGRILIGSTEEPEAGFSKENTEMGIARLRTLAERAIPVLKNRTIEKCWAGLRPAASDGLPVVGVIPGWKNAFIATGHFRSGIQLSIGTAQVMTDLMTDKEPEIQLDAFRPGRVKSIHAKPLFRS